MKKERKILRKELTTLLRICIIAILISIVSTANINAQTLDNYSIITVHAGRTVVVTVIETNFENSARQFLLQTNAPEAAAASVSGQVLSGIGSGISKAHVTITNQNGESQTVLTNQFGYYRFDEVEVGETYIFTVRAKGYQFSQSAQVHTIVGETEDINFVGNR
jgi:hypothetical protein